MQLTVTCLALPSIIPQLAWSEAAEAGVACAVRSWHSMPASIANPMWDSWHILYLASTAGSVYLSAPIYTMART